MAKREIYARLGVQLRTNRRCFKAERVAPGAFGLYAWCVIDARAELPDQDGHHPPGFVAEEAVLSALGRPSDERLAQAEALCAVDLLERVDGGFVVVKYEEHNDTWKDVKANRKASRERKRASRVGHDDVTRDKSVTPSVCHGEVPISYSLSPAVRDQVPVREGESARGGPPSWFTDAVAMLEQNAPDVHRGLGHIGERWMQYQGAISRGRAQTAAAAAGWLTSTVRSERASASKGAAAKKQPLGSAASLPWADPNRNDGFDQTGTGDE